jgi:hypothetical protein
LVVLGEVGLCRGYKPLELVDTGDLPAEEHRRQMGVEISFWG